ncbi:MAG: hypothetical protein ABIJ59_19525 [Pseudomonadota bacterium]
MFCLFCSKPEKTYAPKDDFICSSCVQMLLVADQEELKRAHALAFEKGYPNKAWAIESFLEEEEHHGKAEHNKRNLERTRSLPASRSARHQIRA